jgi:hypothetical protein
MASIAIEEVRTLAGADIPLRMYLAHKRRQTLSVREYYDNYCIDADEIRH